MPTSERSARRLPDAATLREAQDRLAGVARPTPLERSAWLSERVGTEVYLKLECWQRTGSFKLRGAYNAVATLEPGLRDRGLVTASAGNHGLALAHAARVHGAPATIFVPATAPETKKRRIRREGAGLVEVEGTYDDAAAAARDHAATEGTYLLHAFDDPAVIAGQGTVGVEIADALPAVREVIVPVGGGGLAAGVGAALAALAAGSRVRGVQSTATRAMFDAFDAGEVIPSPEAPTLCDGLAGETEPGAYEAVRSVLHDLRLVDEEEVAPAIRSLYREEGVVAEGAGAVGVAALLSGALAPTGPAVVVISGGNIDGDRLARILSEE